MYRLALFTLLISAAFATDVKPCKSGILPSEVRIIGCKKLPCDVIKGKNIELEIDFNAGDQDADELQAKVRATALGITVPYPLPDDIANVCANLANGQECPLDAGEDGTYLFKFPVGNYPEIGVAVEVTLKNQDDKAVACFVADIKVKSS